MLRLASLMLAVPVALAPSLAHADATCVPSRAMIVLDKSSSMLGTIGGQTKWDIARSALEQVTTTFDSSIDLGLMLFPSPGQCGPGHVNVDVGPNSGAAIISALGTPPPAAGNWTPMAQTLDAAASVGSLNDPSRTRYVILITDGWQWCSPYDPATRFTPVDSVERLEAAGVKTFVVGFGNEVDVATLNQMAINGGTGRAGCDPTGDTTDAANPCYFQADSPAELEAALQQIGVTVTAEICDGIDNDCDGQIDEALTQGCSTACGSGTETCTAGVWGGCDAPPAGVEVCDGLDNDCDGSTDPGCGGCAPGATMPCGSDQGACAPGLQTCGQDGVWGSCTDATGPSPELCNGVDDDCDGLVDGTVDNAGLAEVLCQPGELCQDGACTPVTPEDPPTPEVPEDPSQGVPDGGCGCTVGGQGTSASFAGALAFLALGAVLLRRRKK
jgi:MYXO-CTERM domain-containing protein